MLKPIDKQRLEKLKAELRLLNLRFPVAVLSERMDTNKGNLSAYLNGKKPISDQFLRKFYEVFKEDLEKAALEPPPPPLSEEQENEEGFLSADYFEPPSFLPPGINEKGVLEGIQYQLNVIINLLTVLDNRQQSIEALLLADSNGAENDLQETSE